VPSRPAGSGEACPVAFDFSEDAKRECVRYQKQSGRIIKLQAATDRGNRRRGFFVAPSGFPAIPSASRYFPQENG
jgi:hypothetical protein